MVENAIQSGDGAAANILRQIRGQKPERVEVKFTYDGLHRQLFRGIGNHGQETPSWLSVVMKFMVNSLSLRDYGVPWTIQLFKK
jgi:hypothetical protein